MLTSFLTWGAATRPRLSAAVPTVETHYSLLLLAVGTALAQVNVLWSLLLFSVALAPPAALAVGRRAPRLLLGVGLTCIVLLAAQSASPLATLAGELRRLPRHVQFQNDAVALTSCATALFVSGHNPYTSVNLGRCLWRSGYTRDGSLLTPLQRGRFAHLARYPSPGALDSELHRLVNRGIARPLEFEWQLSYPAGSFLLPAATWLLGITDLRLFGLLCFLAAYLFILGRAPRPLWPWIVVLALTNAVVWTKAASGSSDALYTLLVLLAWSLRRHGIASALAMGLAVATRQQACLFLIFYAILIAREEGPMELWRRLSLVAGVALLANLPFVLASPAAWASGVVSPVVDPMFPRGVGLISIVLALDASVPLPPRWLFGALEVAVLAACAALYWRTCRRRPHPGLVLAILPLFVAWRSLSSYFFIVSILVLGGIVELARSRSCGASRAPAG